MKKKFILLAPLQWIFLLLALMPILLFAQSYHISNYSVEEGLAQSQVTTIAQDKAGNLWLGTHGGGLSQFNGFRFKNFTTKEGLIANNISCLYVDSRGHLWIGTSDGLCQYFPDTNNISKCNFIKYGIEDGLIGLEIKTICEDNNGNIWLGTRNGLSVLKKESIVLSGPKQRTEMGKRQSDKKMIFENFTLKNGLIDTLIFSIEKDNFGNIYIGTRLGLNRVLFSKNGESFKFDRITEKNGLIRNSIVKVYKDHLGKIWFLTPKGFSMYDPATSLLSENFILLNYFFDEKNVKVLPNSNYRSITQDKNGDFLLGTEGEGVYKLGFNQSTQQCYIHEKLNSQNGLSSDYVWSLFTDREGNLWVGTDGGGISKYMGRDFESFTDKDGLINSAVSSITRDNKGRFWFGTFENGISMLDMSKPASEIKEKFTTLNTSTGFPDNIVSKIIQDREGMMWAATEKGAILWDPEQKHKKYMLIKLNDTLIGKMEGYNYTTDVMEDSKGNFWLGSAFLGVYKLVKDITEKNGFKLYNYSKKEGLSTRMVYVLFEDRDGNIWVGTSDGLSKIIKGIETNPKIQNFTKKEGLIDNQILSIFQDLYGNLWFGTSGGLSKMILNPEEGYNPKSNIIKFQNFTTENGLSSDLVYLINSDDEGNLYFGTSKGIDKYFIRKGIFKFYGKADGFTGIECNQKATYKDKEGNLWFGTIKGAIKFNPRDEVINEYEPITTITGIKLFFKDTDIPAERQFKYNQNYLTFEFAGVSLSVPEKVRYQWKLEGLDKDWAPESKENKITYSNLTAGDYTFMVKACNNDGLWNKNPTTFSFTILPPFWKTWWAYSVYIFMLISGVLGAIRFSTRRLTRAKIILEQKVKERTREVVQQKNELYKLSIVASKTDNAVMIADPDGKFEWVNEGFVKMHGFTLEEFVAVKGATLQSSSRNSEFEKMMKECIKNNKSTVYQSINERKNGEKFWVQSTLTPVFREEELEKIVVIDTDITLRKNAEEEVAQKNKDLTDSIHYAKRLQDAILPPVGELRAAIGEHFILFKPRDIVSGDFYWISEGGREWEMGGRGEGEIGESGEWEMGGVGESFIFALADCTGHGVPGAFMSIIGSNLLDEVVNKQKTDSSQGTTLTKMLTNINEGIMSHVHTHSDSGFDVNDGMDISLVHFRKNTGTQNFISLSFAGAQQGLILISNGAITEMKGDKHFLGGFMHEREKLFIQKETTLKPGDMIYLYTDGYADQLGGFKNKRFSFKRFKELLLEIYTLPLSEQKEILNKSIENWKNQAKESQTDDITVVGVRV